MARKPRLHVPGGFTHVMLRGNGGADIFFAEADRRRFLDLIAEGVERFGHRLHGYCLMTNHVHLVVQAGEAPLSRAMQNLAFRYTRQVNARKKRIGHLFQGRYKALLVDAESYLLELVRYVHLNPVRAGLVADPADWPWSGQRAYLGREDLPWLTTDWVLAQFGRRRAGARAGYRAFVAAGLGEGSRRSSTWAGTIRGCWARTASQKRCWRRRPGGRGRRRRPRRSCAWSRRPTACARRRSPDPRGRGARPRRAG